MSGDPISDNERRVLVVLAEGYGERAYYFRHIQKETGLERKSVRLICRSLAARGLAAYMRGLMTEDGYCAGAGYASTSAGEALIREGQ